MKRRRKIPTSVRIGGVRYRVVLEEEMEGEEGVELLGQHDYGRLQLRLSLATHPELRPFVLLHEVLHACVTVSGGDSHREEALVAGLSHVLLQVLRENPDLVRYLLGDQFPAVEDSGDSGRSGQDATSSGTATEADGGST